MILLVGIASEPPLELVADELGAAGEPFVLLHQRRWRECDIAVEVRDGTVAGRLRIGALAVPLEDVRAVYTRQVDDQALPDVSSLPPGGSPDALRCRAFHETLSRWMELTPARVINRTASQASNGSKPYQAQIIRRHGLEVPETLVTNDPDAVRSFRSEHGRLIYKSISGVRSIVRELTDDDLGRIDSIRWCPVQFQAHVAGFDVRVHCVGGDVFASRIVSDATDYRYAIDQAGEAAEVAACEIDDETAERCLALTEALGLELSGIDLRITPEGRTFCFEVNPSPGFSYYELNTGQPIAHAIARHLAAATLGSQGPTPEAAQGSAPPR